MTCRESRLSSAMVTFARDMTGLEDNQILSINHALMQEGVHAAGTTESWNTTIDRIEEEYRTGELNIAGRSRDPIARLELARTERPDGSRIYAAEHLMRRALLAQEANTAWLVNTARDMGYSMPQMQTLFNTVFAEASRDASLQATAPFAREWNANPSNANLFQDRRTMYAYQQIENQRREAVENQPFESAVTEQYTFNNPESAVRSISLDDSSGYTMVNYAEGNYEIYNLPADISHGLVTSSNPAEYIRNNIASNSAYQYANAAEAHEAGIVRRCATCGQFASRVSSHACPVSGSPESIDNEIREATRRLRSGSRRGRGAAAQASTVATIPDTLTPTVSRLPIQHSSAIREIGYSAEANRLEIVMASNPNHVYAYRMVPEEYQEFIGSSSLGRYFAQNIRSNPLYAYASEEHAEANRFRCATCGQFANSAHICQAGQGEETVEVQVPVAAVEETFSPEVEETLADWERELLSYVDDENFVPEEFQDQNLPTRPEPTILTSNIRNTRHDVNGIYYRMPSVNRLRQEARNNGDIAFRVMVNEPTGCTLSGFVEAHYNGRGQGYSIPEDSGLDIDRRLRCSCPDYQQTRSCVHTEAVMRDVGGLLNNTQAATPAQAATATANVTSSLDRQLQASLEASAKAEERFTKMNTSFVEDPEKFQGLYEEYRAKRQTYMDALAAGDVEGVEYPVPYMTENAFGGLGTRESGRGLGIEIEFAFPRDMDGSEIREARRLIGEELYNEGLTRSAHQGGYGASHGWVRDHHARGWSFEDDGTTGGSDAYSGGEIVSPIMYDEPETWTNLEKVTSILKRHGAVVSKGSGLHVHASIGDYDHRIENHNRLISAFAENEDLIYRLSSNPERGKHRGTGYCSPNNIPSTPYGEVDSMRRRNVGHHIGLNMQSVSGRSSDHVEFRTFDSSLNPAVIQAQMGVALYISEGALRQGTASVNPGENRVSLGSRVEANPDRANTSGAAWQESTKSLRKFLDVFVPGSGGDETENPRVQQMIAMFAVTRWQRRSSRNSNY